jgi:phospholipid/cholesterol/gamma-HCH transport system permease protein
MAEANPIERLGAATINGINNLGAYGRFTTAILKWAIRGPGAFARKQMFVQMYEIGILSIPVVMVTGAFIGAVLAIETFPQFQEIGLAGHIGAVINVSVVKQIGPVLTGVMLAGRVGGALTAELGTMKVTEQLDALRAMAADPIRVVATPRVIACLIMMPALTIFSDLLGIFGGWLMSVPLLHVDNGDYWFFASQSMENYTIFIGLIKSLFFGAAIASISCYKGFNCGSGAQGVGRACTEAFVASFITILMMNFFLALLMNNIYLIFWPNVEGVFG